VIPVIEERNPEIHQLFKDLPVVQMPRMREANTTQEFQTAIQNYLESDAFQNSAFDGWQRLFLKYWRRKTLQDTGRDIDQDEQGREYYLAWRYTSKSHKGKYTVPSQETAQSERAPRDCPCKQLPLGIGAV
jgi:hypothetical protein